MPDAKTSNRHQFYLLALCFSGAIHTFPSGSAFHTSPHCSFENHVTPNPMSILICPSNFAIAWGQFSVWTPNLWWLNVHVISVYSTFSGEMSMLTPFFLLLAWFKTIQTFHRKSIVAIHLLNPWFPSSLSMDFSLRTAWPSMTGWWFGTFSIFPYIGNNHPNWLSYFSEGFKPPTRWLNHSKAMIFHAFPCHLWKACPPGARTWLPAANRGAADRQRGRLQQVQNRLGERHPGASGIWASCVSKKKLVRMG